MFVDTRDIGLASHLLTDGYWEMWNTEAMVQLVKPGMKAIDIGANLGYFTLLLAELVGPDGEVHAFEPNPAMVEMLASTVEINSFAQRAAVHSIALSDYDGEAGVVVPKNQPKNAHLVDASHADALPVEVRRFDSFPELMDADFIKIDVEGAERAVWDGMERLLRQNRPLTIILEFTPDRYPDASAFIEALVKDGFTLERIDPREGIVETSNDWLLRQPIDEDQLLVLTR